MYVCALEPNDSISGCGFFLKMGGTILYYWGSLASQTLYPKKQGEGKGSGS